MRTHPSIFWMMLAAVFMTGMYAGRFSVQHFWAEAFMIIAFFINTCIWAWMRFKEDQERNEARRIMKVIRRSQEDG